MNSELYHDSEVVESIAPKDTNSDTDGSTVDLQGFGGVMFVLSIGDIADGESASFKLQESDNDSDWSDVADEDLYGSEPSVSGTTDDDSQVSEVAYAGDKRYVRAVLTAPSTSKLFAATAVKFTARHKPTR